MEQTDVKWDECEAQSVYEVVFMGCWLPQRHLTILTLSMRIQMSTVCTELEERPQEINSTISLCVCVLHNEASALQVKQHSAVSERIKMMRSLTAKQNGLSQ